MFRITSAATQITPTDEPRITVSVPDVERVPVTVAATFEGQVVDDHIFQFDPGPYTVGLAGSEADVTVSVDTEGFALTDNGDGTFTLTYTG